MNRIDAARAYYLRALEQEPDNVHALLGLGILELREENEAAGMARLERVLEIDPANDPAREAVSAYRKRGR